MAGEGKGRTCARQGRTYGRFREVQGRTGAGRGQDRIAQDRTEKGRTMQGRAVALPDCERQGQDRAGRCRVRPGKAGAG